MRSNSGPVEPSFHPARKRQKHKARNWIRPVVICLREGGAEDDLVPRLPFPREGSPDLVGVTEGTDATSVVKDLFRDSMDRTSSSIIDEGGWLIGQIILITRTQNPQANLSVEGRVSGSFIQGEEWSGHRTIKDVDEHEEFDRC